MEARKQEAGRGEEAEAQKKDCRACKSARATQVHHLRYTVQVLRGGSGQLRFLWGVCRGCHRGIEFEGERKRTAAEVDSASRLARKRRGSCQRRAPRS